MIYVSQIKLFITLVVLSLNSIWPNIGELVIKQERSNSHNNKKIVEIVNDKNILHVTFRFGQSLIYEYSPSTKTKKLTLQIMPPLFNKKIDVYVEDDTGTHLKQKLQYNNTYSKDLSLAVDSLNDNFVELYKGELSFISSQNEIFNFYALFNNFGDILYLLPQENTRHHVSYSCVFSYSPVPDHVFKFSLTQRRIAPYIFPISYSTQKIYDNKKVIYNTKEDMVNFFNMAKLKLPEERVYKNDFFKSIKLLSKRKLEHGCNISGPTIASYNESEFYFKRLPYFKNIKLKKTYFFSEIIPQNFLQNTDFYKSVQSYHILTAKRKNGLTQTLYQVAKIDYPNNKLTSKSKYLLTKSMIYPEARFIKAAHDSIPKEIALGTDLNDKFFIYNIEKRKYTKFNDDQGQVKIYSTNISHELFSHHIKEVKN